MIMASAEIEKTNAFGNKTHVGIRTTGGKLGLLAELEYNAIVAGM